MGKVAAVIVAAGTGSRMGSRTVSKQFLSLKGRPILTHTLKRFDDYPEIDHIVMVIREQERRRCEHIIAESDIRKVLALVQGGQERQDSVCNGLLRLPDDTEIVLIHDAVRIFVTDDILRLSIQYARECGASVTAVPANDTIKKVTSRQRSLFVEETLDRHTLWQVQTPQTFRYQLICSMHQRARQQGFRGTDDAMLVEHFGHPVKIVPGSYRNIKITTPDDLLIAEAFLQHDTEAS
jgi:2-C-methyl-D-erythritol 4-phosphate cytidylyltransferase